MSKILVILLLAFVLTSCEMGADEGTVTVTWEIIYVEGMPCVVTDGIQAGGVSCDWSQHRGNDERE